MTEAPSYPEAAQVADDLIANTLKLVRDEVVRGFDRQERYNDKLDQRFETMVTKSEFKAEIGRVDTRHDSLQREVATLGEQLADALIGIRKDMSGGFSEIKKQGEERSTKSRWFTGIALTAAGLVSGIVFNILAALPGK